MPWGKMMLGAMMLTASVARAQAGPAIASDWDDLNLPQAECFERGEAAIRRMEFSRIEKTQYSRFGQKDDYTVSVRCVSEKNTVLFLAAGPEQRRTQEFQIELHRQYLLLGRKPQ